MKQVEVRAIVIIVGTMHLEPKEYPEYAKCLEGIIEEIAPDIICAELSPEQLAGSQPCNSKPEQRDVIIPTARRLHIDIIPIQPPTEYGRNWESRLRKVNDELGADECNGRVLEYMDLLAQKEMELWMEAMRSPEYFEQLQLNEWHLMPKARDLVDRQSFPRRAELFMEWNECFLAEIERTIGTNSGRRILILAGAWHKYWLWDKLQNRADIVLHNLHSFRKSRNNN
jgi:hypothetical protein